MSTETPGVISHPEAVCCYEHVANKSAKNDVVSQCTKSEMLSLQVLLLGAVYCCCLQTCICGFGMR